MYPTTPNHPTHPPHRGLGAPRSAQAPSSPRPRTQTGLLDEAMRPPRGQSVGKASPLVRFLESEPSRQQWLKHVKRWLGHPRSHRDVREQRDERNQLIERRRRLLPDRAGNLGLIRRKPA